MAYQPSGIQGLEQTDAQRPTRQLYVDCIHAGLGREQWIRSTILQMVSGASATDADAEIVISLPQFTAPPLAQATVLYTHLGTLTS